MLILEVRIADEDPGIRGDSNSAQLVCGVAKKSLQSSVDGNLYVGDIENDRIVKISPDLKMTTLVQDKDKLIWPDSYSIANGFLYISCSQIKFMPWFNNGSDLTLFPYQLYRLKLQEDPLPIRG